VSKQTLVLIGIVLGLVIIAVAGFGGQFTTTSGQCGDVPLLDENNRPITSFNQYRLIIGADLSDSQLESSGLAIVDGVLVATNQCPEVFLG
jgi:hypothetical protein